MARPPATASSAHAGFPGDPASQEQDHRGLGQRGGDQGQRGRKGPAGQYSRAVAEPGQQRARWTARAGERRTRLRRGELAAATVRWAAMAETSACCAPPGRVGTCRADTVASGGLLCLSYLATRHHRTPEHASVRAEPDDLYAGSHAGW